MDDKTDNKRSADWALQVLTEMAKACENPDVHCGNCGHHERSYWRGPTVYCWLKDKTVFLSEALECKQYIKETQLQCAAKGDKMNAEHPKTLTDENIRAINSVLAKDQRVELIPTERGVRVIHVKREEVKT